MSHRGISCLCYCGSWLKNKNSQRNLTVVELATVLEAHLGSSPRDDNQKSQKRCPRVSVREIHMFCQQIISEGWVELNSRLRA